MDISMVQLTHEQERQFVRLQQIAAQAYEIVLGAEKQLGCAYTVHGDELDELRRLCEVTEPKPYRVVPESEWQEHQVAMGAMRQALEGYEGECMCRVKGEGRCSRCDIAMDVLKMNAGKAGARRWMALEQIAQVARWYVSEGMIPARDGTLGVLLNELEGSVTVGLQHGGKS